MGEYCQHTPVEGGGIRRFFSYYLFLGRYINKYTGNSVCAGCGAVIRPPYSAMPCAEHRLWIYYGIGTFYILFARFFSHNEIFSAESITYTLPLLLVAPVAFCAASVRAVYCWHLVRMPWFPSAVEIRNMEDVERNYEGSVDRKRILFYEPCRIIIMLNGINVIIELVHGLIQWFADGSV